MRRTVKWELAANTAKHNEIVTAMASAGAVSEADRQMRILGALALCMMGAIGAELHLRTGMPMSNLPQPTDHSSLARKKALETLEKLDELLNSIEQDASRAADLEKQNEYLRSALSYITEGRGARDRDPLKHADNCIDNMKNVAVGALAGTWEKE